MLVVNKSPEHVKASLHIQQDTLESYLLWVINIYSSLQMPRKKWLTGREKTFFIATIRLIIENITNPISDEAVQIYKEIFNKKTNKTEISNYLIKLGKKKWVNYDKETKEVRIPKFFNVGSSDYTIDFEIRLQKLNNKS